MQEPTFRFQENDRVPEALSMTETITSQLEMICKRLKVYRLQKLEGIFEHFSDLERLTALKLNAAR